ncbi:MAG: outer membrane beta-barrel family protein [Lachnoclostridium sp.]|nr:outer membrane beta-barrel family protein [Lachnoclostridium sp.]
MKKFAILILILTTVVPTVWSQSKVTLCGRIRDAVTKYDLVVAKVLVYDSIGNVKDTLLCNDAKGYERGEVVDIAEFYYGIQPVDSTYVFDVICDGYMPQTITYHAKNLGRKRYVEMPVTYMTRAPHKLGEVTVTASKIKFYNKGDTIVFNADAFQLAEGSMLDGLIAQLPGVELNDDGQIKVNGEFVESLLLNGKDFLDGNNQLMLENIAAYTVKNVEVYRGQTLEDQWLRKVDAPKVLTMNVKLKKEFNGGTIINAQGGAGTENRYTGRLFASRFTATSKLTLLGNVNNLNDNRKPGKSDTWTPDMMPSGTRQYRMATIDYRYDNAEETAQVSAVGSFEQTRTHDYTTTAKTNFLGSRNTYENAFDRNNNVDTRVKGDAFVRLRNDKVSGYVNLSGLYRTKSNGSESLSGSFNDEQANISADMLRNIYVDANPLLLKNIINRSSSMTDGSSHNLDLRFTPGVSFSIPGTNDALLLECYTRYNSVKEDRWRDYTINFGDNPTPSDRRRQYFDNTPNHTFTSVNNITYRYSLGDFHLALNYEYRFSDQEKDSYMYALERLNDMGAYGVLPAGYLDAFDPANSYTSRLIENKHSISPSLMYFSPWEKVRLSFYLMPNFSLKHQHLDYWRDGRSYLLKQTDFIVTAKRYDMMIFLSFGAYKNEKGSRAFKNRLELSSTITPTTPDPFERLDVINDSDPLNITSGNPNLKTSYNFENTIEWTFMPNNPRHRYQNNLRLSWSTITNDLTRGYTYNTATGVRNIRTYNVDGNSSGSVENNFMIQFGRKEQFTLSSMTTGSIIRSADMIGVDNDVPSASHVNTSLLTEKLSFAWQIGKQTITLNGSASTRRTTSPREDFTSINARHFTYGINGNFKLPAGFGISTDLTNYTRRGYGMKEIDKSFVVWNLRLSYCPPRASRFVFMVDGFDMLHQLSNVNYAVNAAGRTVSYTNALPRYVLFSVQYRLNLQPKKR